MIQISKRICGGIAAAVLTLATAIPVGAADDATPSVAEELLQILRAAGTIDDAKYQELAERAKKEEAERIEAAVQRVTAQAQLPPVAAAKEGPTDWTVNWNKGFNVARNDGAFKFKFGGRIQNDWALIDMDDELDDAIGGEGNGVEFRRARIFFEGTAYERLIFKSQVDFANTGDGTVDIKDMFMGLTGLGPVGTVKVGHMKEPFSLDEQGSSKYLVFLERGLPNVFSPGRNTGFMASNSALDERLVWQAGIFHDANDSGFGFSDNRAWNTTARISGLPFYADDGAKLVHLGLGYSHQFRDEDNALRYRERPEAHLANRFLDTAGIPTQDVDLLAAEFATVWGPASFQSEYIRSFVQGHGTEDTTFWGTYAQASYFLTGEHRNYELGDGFFGRVSPAKNFNPAQGDWGAWEVAARFSYLDLEDEFVEGGRMWDVTAAINWYLYPNARVMLNYIHSHVDDRVVVGPPEIRGVNGDADIVQARFQLDF